MEIKNLYEFTFSYHQRVKKDKKGGEDKIIYSDSDDIHQLSSIPQNALFAYCKKWDDETQEFVAVKNYAIGRELTKQDLNDEMERTNSGSKKLYIETILNWYFSPKNNGNGIKYAIFKNQDSICVYDTSNIECEFITENRLVREKVVDEREVDYSNKDYINLE